MPYKDPILKKAYLDRTREKKRQRDREYAAAHREENKARAKAWWEANKERAKESNKKWRLANPERFNTFRKNWAIRNKEKNAIIQRKYITSLEGKMSKAQRAHKRRVLVADGATITTKELQEMRRSAKSCHYCGSENNPLTVDHVVAIANGGKHQRENIVFACRSCNCKKSTKDANTFAMEVMAAQK